MSSKKNEIPAAETLAQITARLQSAAERIAHNATIRLCNEEGATLLYEATYEDVKNIICAGDFIRYFPMLVSEVRDIFGVKEATGCRRWHTADLYPNNTRKTSYRRTELLLDSEVMALGIDVLVERTPKNTCNPEDVTSVLHEFLFGNPPANSIAVRFKNSMKTYFYTKVPFGTSGKIWAVYWEGIYGKRDMEENSFEWNPIMPSDMKLVGYISSNKEIITNSCVNWVEELFPKEICPDENCKRLHDVCFEIENRLYSHVENAMTIEDLEKYAVSDKRKAVYQKYSGMSTPEEAALLGQVEREFRKGKESFSAHSRSLCNHGFFSLLNGNSPLNFGKPEVNALTLSEFACRYLIDKETAFNWCLDFFFADDVRFEVTLKQKVFTKLGNQYLATLTALYDLPWDRNDVPEYLEPVFTERQIREVLNRLSSESKAKTVVITFNGKRGKVFSCKVSVATLLEKGYLSEHTDFGSDVKAALILANKTTLDLCDITSITYRGKKVWPLSAMK